MFEIATGTQNIYLITTYTNASNNVHLYCELVNETLEDRNFSTIIYDSRDKHGRTKVFYKTTRNITAKEEIGTRCLIYGSYWDKSKTYSNKFMNKLNAYYHKLQDRIIPT